MSKSSIDSPIENALRFLSDNKNIIRGIYKHISYNDEPKLYGYSVSFKGNYGNADGEADAGGLSFNQKRALIRALGETIERFSLSKSNGEKIIYKSFRELIKSKKSALNPKTLVLHSHKKNFADNLDSRKFHWVEGKNLSSNKKILVPAQSIYVPYVHQNSEPTLSFPISTGAAAGTSLTDALYSGICEVVERDSFMIAYLNKISSPHVDLPSMSDNTIRDILQTFTRYNLELIVLDLTTNLQIPAFAAIILDRTGVGPSVSVGLKAGFNITDTIIGAIEESQMVRFYARNRISSKESFNKTKVIRTIEDRASFWFPTLMIKELDFWVTKKGASKKIVPQFSASGDYLEKTVALLSQKGIDIIYVDITDKIVKEYGFTVVKVIIPRLQPLYLDEMYPLMQNDRIYKTPVEMGYFQKPKRKSELNKISHPFL